MTSTARSHSRVRRTEAGAAWLDGRSRGSFGSSRKLFKVLARLDQPDVVERALGDDEAKTVALVALLLRRAIDAIPTPLPKPTVPPPKPPTRDERYAVFGYQVVWLDGVAHAQKLGNLRNRRSECLGCGASFKVPNKKARRVGVCGQCRAEGRVRVVDSSDLLAPVLARP